MDTRYISCFHTLIAPTDDKELGIIYFYPTVFNHTIRGIRAFMQWNSINMWYLCYRLRIDLMFKNEFKIQG